MVSKTEVLSIYNTSRTMIIFITAVTLCCLVSSKSIVPAAASISGPHCQTRERCDEIWDAPNISDCINNTCQCTGESVYVDKRKTCQCKDGYVVGSTKCLPVTSSLGSHCKEDVQCTKMLGELTTCTGYQCHCVSGAVSVNGICQKKKYYSEKCNYTQECSHIQNVVCKDNVCACNDGFVPAADGKACLQALKSLWDACIDDIQCSEAFGDGSRCLTKCVCKSEYHNQNNIACIKNKGLGELCSRSSDCYIETDPHSSTVDCVGGRCNCLKGFKPSADNQSCDETSGGETCSLSSLSMLIVLMPAVSVICRHP